MNCPIDGTELRLSERQGIEIDDCPRCRGVWLDRGELDKLIERSAMVPFSGERREPAEERRAASPKDRLPRDWDDWDDDRDRSSRGSSKSSRRRSMLGDLFDFD